MCRALAVLVAAAVASVVTFAQTQTNPDRFTHERQIVTAGAGPQRLAVDDHLLSYGSPFRIVRRGAVHTAEGGLSDLRLFDQAGRPVPHLLIATATGEPEWIAGTVLTVADTKKTSGFEVDLGSAEPVDMIRVGGLPVPHLKRLSLEGSGDRARWTLLVPEGTLFDLPDEKLRQDSLGFEVGPYRYLRVTWNDANSGRVPVPRKVFARRASRGASPIAPTIDVSLEPRPSEPGRSRYRIRLPAARLPVIALELDVAPGPVYRGAMVTESRFTGTEATPAGLGIATLARVTRDGATASALRVPITAPTEAEIELTIDDSANPPLELRRVSVVLAQLPWIYFEAPQGPVVARYGNPALGAPVFDLEALRDSVDLSTLREAKWGEARTVTPTNTPLSTPLPEAGAALDATPFEFRRGISASSAGLVAVPLDAHALAHSRGPDGRFADVRVLDASSRQIPYLLERRNEPLSVDVSIKPAPPVRIKELKPGTGRQRSVYVVTLPYSKLPSSTLVVETSARVFHRSVTVGIERLADRNSRDAWFDLIAAETWRHADQQTPAKPLALRLGTLEDTEVLLVVDEGDNASLPIANVRVLLPSYRLRFYHPAGTALQLAYGRRDLLAPQYDLALLAPQVMGAAAREIVADQQTIAATRSSDRSIVSPRTFWVILGAAVLVLVALIVKLIRSQDQPASP
jgi:hypothetical protein